MSTYVHTYYMTQHVHCWLQLAGFLRPSGSKLFLVYERAKKHACDVNEHPVIANHSMKFRTFISLLLRWVILLAF